MNNAATEERLVRIIDEHWVKYLLPGTMYLLLEVIAVLMMYSAHTVAMDTMLLSHALLIVGFALMLIAHHWFFMRIMSEKIDCIVITNQRSISFKTNLFLHDEMIENTYQRMYTVEAVKEGIVQNILNYGTLKFLGGRDIHLVPHPNSVARDIEQAMGRR